ncbi:exodeoxyribonuclease III [Candidatus Saccharibacteria bacterium]|nr:exodeoxyribonuclease III [Candidatus Saccharibacteria bacterium]
MLRIFSWNVNGVRAVLRKGALQKFLNEYQPDILCLQEIKAKPEQVEYDFPGYKVAWNPAKRAGYSGTATLLREESLPLLFSADLLAKNVIRWTAGRTASDEANLSGSSGIYIFGLANQNIHASKNNGSDSLGDIGASEGRILAMEFDKFFLVNVYTPNSKPDLSRLKLRHESWDPEFLQLLKELERTKPVVVCGDFNAAHTEIDLARPKTNHHNAGFTDEEREGVGKIIGADFMDTFRELHPDSQRYTWWSHWGKARENNVGWRIDYFFVSGALESKLLDAEIYENVTGSDHCPISITLEI